jgi:hypothetical protein
MGIQKGDGGFSEWKRPHRDPADENALIQASGKGHLKVVKLLVSRGADVNARIMVEEWNGHSEWRTPLSMARKGCYEAVVAFLLASGARE